MHLFYSPDITIPIYNLTEEESKHCIRVLRLKINDTIYLIDGIGGYFKAIIMDDHPKKCIVKILEIEKKFKKSNFYLHIAIAPTKNMDRMEWFTEKATEIGINEISLIDCDYSERTIVKTERLKKVAIAAIKQSLKAYLPIINETVNFKKFIVSMTNFTGQKFIAHCNTSEGKEITHLKNQYHPLENAIILIGPEGDFSIEEIQLAIDNGFKEISLGESRLRTETAAIYACTTINILQR